MLHIDFNSTVVRLKEIKAPFSKVAHQYFNSTVVRLKDHQGFQLYQLFQYFNSTVVRLKVGVYEYLSYFAEFQFHSSSIKRIVSGKIVQV